MASQRERMEEERSDDELAALYRGEFAPRRRDVDFPELSAKITSPFPRFREGEPVDDLDAAEMWRESRLDRVEWTGSDETGDFVSHEAERLMQERPDVIVTGGGGASGKNREYKPVKAVRNVIVEGRGLCAVVSYHVRGLTRGSIAYYRSHPGSARSLLQQLIEGIVKGEIPPTMPQKKRDPKMKTWGAMVWFPADTQVSALRTRKRIAAQWLNMVALDRGGEKIARLNSLDEEVSTFNALAKTGIISYDLGTEMG